jgi:hypothetical protein
MQCSQCLDCIYNGRKCKMIMAQAMGLLSQFNHLLQYSQPYSAEARCSLKIDLSCENFIRRK